MAGIFRRRWRRWVNRRIPRSDSQTFSQRNVFILPTGAGAAFCFLLLVMLLTGINYQNSLIYLLTFLLGAIFVAAMHQTHRNLVGLRLTLINSGEGFPGADIEFRLRATSDESDAIAIRITPEEGDAESFNVIRGELVEVSFSAQGVSRGPVATGDVRVETRFPFGLLTAWSWMRPVREGLCYPRAITPPDVPAGADEGEQSSGHVSSSDLSNMNIRPWRQGDLTQRVLWKRYARSGEMVITEWEGDAADPVWLDFDSFPGVDRELRLSYLAALVEQRDQLGTPYGLRLPGSRIEPDVGRLHRTFCLRALGQFGYSNAGTESATAVDQSTAVANAAQTASHNHG
ncbi:DUF58 domain-containing protein [Marinobacter sp. 1Y8]